jgi:hypothetical protein
VCSREFDLIGASAPKGNLGSARRATMAVATKGAHAGVQDYLEAVKQARVAVEDLGRLTS